MKKFLVLTKILLKSGLGGSREGKKKVKKNKFGIVESSKSSTNMRRYIFIGICMIPLMISLYFLSLGVCTVMYQYGMEAEIINLICSTGTLVVFVFGMGSVLSVFYFTKDIETLLTLPLTPQTIVSSKFAVSLIYEYPIAVIVLVPLLAGYGIAVGCGPVYWVMMVMTILLLSVAPLIYSGIISMLIMRVLKGGKSKDIFSVMLSFILVIFIMAANLGNSALESMTNSELASTFDNLNDRFGGVINIIFPNLFLIKNALHEENFLYMLLFIGTLVVLTVVFLLIGKYLYFKGVADVNSSVSKRKVFSEEENRKIMVRQNVFLTYIKKEIRILVRTPSYIMNCVLMAFIWPLFFVIPFYITVYNGTDGDLSSVYELFTNATHSDIKSAFTIMAVFVVASMISWFNMSSGTSISREGKNLFFMKYIPMPLKKQIRAKIAAGCLIGITSTIIYTVIISVILGAPVYSAILALIVAALINVMCNYIGIIIDIAMPKLEWESEQAAVKQNFNILIGLLLMVIATIILAVIGLILFFVIQISIYIIVLIEIAALLVLIFLFDKAAIYNGENKIRSLG